MDRPYMVNDILSQARLTTSSNNFYRSSQNLDIGKFYHYSDRLTIEGYIQTTGQPSFSATSPPINLRYYQKDAIAQVFELWQQVRRVLVQSPTGSGKSLIISALAQEFLRRGEPVLALAHKVELIRQLRDHLQRCTLIEPGIIAEKSQFKRNTEALIQVASIQALSCQPLDKLPKASIVIIDEAHHSHAKTYSRIFSHYQEAYFLGLTATPLRIDGRGLRYLYDGVAGFEALVTGVPVRQLIEEGYLSDFKLFTSDNLLDPKAAGIHSRAGDYIQSELEEYTDSVLLQGEIVDTWLKHADGKRTVLYPVSVALSKRYCQEFCSSGIAAAHIDADTPPKERENILQKFINGEILVLCQHSIVIEGVDIPLIECVQFARPTKSLTIWFQAIGRALRPAAGKPHAIIIDHTTTHHDLPWIDEPIEWSLDPVSLPNNAAHTLTCPDCSHVFRATANDTRRRWAMCPNCSTKFQFEVGVGGSGRYQVVKVLPADFQELERQLNPEVMEALARLFEEAFDRRLKPGWVAYQVLKIPNIGYFELLEVAKWLNYKPGWAYYKYREILAELGGVA
ncbi:DEAD/DEAH box helicase [Merismopedia glauca]|nr:DEAD/DEAH box helicase [Merismopedia glauca]